LGLKKGLLVALANGELVEHEVEYDADYCKELEKVANQFLDCVTTDVPPAWDGSTSTYETVRTLSEGIHDAEIDLQNLYPDLIAAKENYDVANEQFTLEKSKVLALMDGAKMACSKGSVFSHCNQGGSGGPYIVFKKGN
jgi:predicted phage-related endonuclease